MSELTEQLDKIIQQAALDGTLTQKAVDQFHSIIVQNTALETEVASLETVLDERAKKIDRLEIDLGMAKTLNKVAAEAEIEMIEREKNITTLELTAEHEKQRVKDHINMFTTVFRNSVLRKEVMTPLEANRLDQGMQGQTGYAQKDTVESEET